ncbi:beta-propeller domain-containing protein [Natronoglycomyces albus]|uniref:Beta-propeller domain-containing protein n=1 Tax=Natronoglycomyces albus TaxID=2811108 RepID=A0A895XK27_9ACTN|nr:beta-propeller domain-containing protein [Natronoglycomyces albus]QSB05387.1 beta-propeller domain-containing protein [Natronoglycomyces albus]
MKIPPRNSLAMAAAATALLIAAGCTSGGDDARIAGDINADVDWLDNAVLTSYDSCDEALSSLQKAALDNLDDDLAYGNGHSGPITLYDDDMEVAEAPAGAEEGARDSAGLEASEDFSETNVAETGVDEPDVVKTNGHQIFALVGNSLQIADASSGEVVSTFEFADSSLHIWGASMFLDGDSVMILYNDHDSFTIRDNTEMAAQELVIKRVDVSAEQPRLDQELRFDGGLVDARMVDGQARIVATSHPYFNIPLQEKHWRPDVWVQTWEGVISSSSINEWLPTYTIDGDTYQVPCQALAHPQEYTGMSMVTMLTLPVSGGTFGDGSPVSIAAEAETVYGTSESVYVVNGRSHFGTWMPPVHLSDQKTEIYRFTYEGDGLPSFAGESEVPGYLLNQYSLNEHEGYLRVATTEGDPWATFWDSEGEVSESTVTVLELGDSQMTEVGSVTGLGPEERIYAVRFMGDVAYVVTFRDTDPLYTVDLSVPSEPRVTGELKITGYSAYLHPVGEGLLLGVGQEASLEGRIEGTLVSLFDVSNDEATVLDQYHVPNSYSSVEHDPHAFLYWQPRDLVAIPIDQWDRIGSSSYMTLLEISDEELSPVHEVKMDWGTDADSAWDYELDMRSIVIGDILWTLDSQGLVATDLDSYDVLTQSEWKRD